MITQDIDIANIPSPDICDDIKPLSAFEIKQAEWVIEGWLPKGHITILAADGGSGKTTLWCNVIAALSAGRASILEPEGYQREPQLVAVFSAEDSIESVLKPRLMAAGADQDNIVALDHTVAGGRVLRRYKIGSPALISFVRQYKPALCVLDPIQAFLPPDINMGSRNAMRDCMDQLVTLGAETGTAFLIVCHSNKRTGAAARNRVSDSSDLWDISRSVWMMGNTEDADVRYISHEKSNYGPQQDTVLVSVQDHILRRVGTTTKRDQDYVGCTPTRRGADKSEACKQFILRTLREAPDHRVRSPELMERAKLYDIATATINRVRAQLGKAGIIDSAEIYVNGVKQWYVWLCGDDNPSQDEQLSFDGDIAITSSQA